MKRRTLLNLLDIVIGVVTGYVGYSILNHDASAGEWCIAAICLVVIAFRLFTIIKSAKIRQ